MIANIFSFRFCITNEVGRKDPVPESVNRIGKQAHPLGFAVDGDSSTYWVSASGIYLDGGFSLFLDFKNGVYDVSLLVQSRWVILVIKNLIL